MLRLVTQKRSTAGSWCWEAYEMLLLYTVRSLAMRWQAQERMTVGEEHQ